jgi:alanine racemase
VTSSAKALESSAAVHGFAVAKLHEAFDLRDEGITKPTLLMAPFDEADLPTAVARDITPMVYTPIGDVLDREAARLGRGYRCMSASTRGSGASACRTHRPRR